MAKIKCNPNQAGLTLGILFAILHILWIIAIGIGFGQRLVDWAHSIHFVECQHTILSVSAGTAIIGIITAFISGYILGWLFAVLWNWFGKKIK